MLNIIKRIAYIFAKVIVSMLLFAVGIYCFRHDSSAAFNLGLFLCGAGLCHYVWLPKLTFDAEKGT